MSTKIIYIGIKPATTTGSDVQSNGGHSPASLDQNFANLQAVVDGKAPSASPSFTGDALFAGKVKISDAGSGTVPGLKIYSDTMGFSSPTGTELAAIVGGVTRATINASGNLGLGIVPVQKLHLYNAGSSLYAKLERGTGSLILGADSIGGAVFTDASIPLYFGVNGVEKMRLDNSGNLLAGATSNPYGGRSLFQISGTAGGVAVNNLDTADSSHWLFYGRAAGIDRFVVLGNGNVQNVNNSYGAISDERLKENIEPARNYLTDLCAVRVVKYSLIAESAPAANHLGVIAQELEQIFPGMVEETPDMGERHQVIDGVRQYEQKEVAPAVMDGDLMVSPPVYDDDLDRPVMERYDLGTTTKSVKYSVFVPMLITAVQELKQENDALKQENDVLKQTMQELMVRITALENVA